MNDVIFHRRSAGDFSCGLYPGAGRRGGALRGFTMLEVLVALAIFGMAVVVLGTAYVNVLNNYERVRRDQMIEQEFEFAFSAIMALEEREDFEAGGTIDMPHAGPIQWRSWLTDTEVADLFEAEIHLTYSGRDWGSSREKTETFVLFRPGWQEPEDRERLRQQSRERLEERRNLNSFSNMR